MFRRVVFSAHFFIYGFYLLVAIVVTLPLISVFTTRFAGHPFGDTYELARHMWWIKHALQTGQPIFQQPLLAYPDGLDGSLLWSYPLQSFPAWLFAFFMPLPAAFNLSVLLRLALNGWSAYFLAYHITRSRPAALLAGVIFLAYPSFQGHLAAGHTGLLALYPVPLYVYALFRLRETGERRWIALSVLFFVMSLWGSTQLLVFTLFPITLIFGLSLLFQRDWSTLWKTGLAVVIGALIALIFAVPLLLSTLNEPDYVKPDTGAVDYSIDLFGVIAPSFYHPLFRGNALSVRVIGVDPFEGASYIGVIAAVLALVGVLARREARWWLSLGLMAWIFSLGPLLKMFYAAVPAEIDGYATYITLPWTALYRLPLINITRTPGRFDFTVALAVAMLAAFGMAYLWRRRWLRTIFPLILLLLVFEYLFFWDVNQSGLPAPTLPTLPGIVPEPIAALRDRDDVRAVFDLPWHHLLAAKEGMWLQTGHQQPLIAGHMTRQTPVNPAKLAILQETLDFALLNQAGADIVILHKDWDDPDGATDSFTRATLGEPFYEDENYAAFEVPESDAEPGFLALPTDERRIIDQVDSYVYAPEGGRADFRVRLQATDMVERLVGFYQDGALIARWIVTESFSVTVPVTFAEGYSRLTLTLEPPCSSQHIETLECRAVLIDELAIDGFEPQG
jgi:hypothetical protein